MNTPTKNLLTLLMVLLISGAGTSVSAQSFERKTKRTVRREQAEKRAAKARAEQLKESKPATEVEPQKAEKLTPTTPAVAPQEEQVVLTPAQYDSLIGCWTELRREEYFNHFFDNYVAFDPSEVSTATLPDSVYARRLKALCSPIGLPLNYITRASIVRYTSPESGLMGRVMGLAKHYFPMIEEELLKAGLPVELRAMAIIESALRYDAYSRAGAAGLWQFMPATARSYGLEVNSLVDERYDPIKATQAACRYLKDLYGMFGDWQLAIAAYNCGQGRVARDLARSGGKTFWDIYDYLPSETRGYVPAFVAASYAYAYHRHHGITPVEPPMPLAIDTVHVTRLLHLGQVASTLENTPLETLKMLNPQYRIDILPATTKSYALALPQHVVTEFITHQEEIHAKDSVYLKEYLNPANLDKKRQQASGTIYYKVRRGDTLGKIANRYGVSQRNLMRWNGITNPNRLREGQRLKIIRG